MDIEITSQLENDLFGRKDVQFVLRHNGESTPSRSQVRQMVAGEIGTKTENVVVAELHSTTGIATTSGAARAYKNADLARAQEREFMLRRNQLWQEKKEGDEGDEGGES